MTAEITTAPPCTADFTFNGQSGNYKVTAGVTVTLQADDTEATTYQWQVTSSPPESDYQSTGETQAQATLTPQVPGAYAVQLTVAKDGCQAVARQILWAETPRRAYRLPATGEPQRFDSDQEWAGDLIGVIQDMDGNLPNDDQKAAIEAAKDPSGENPFITESALPPDELTALQKAAIEAAKDLSGENPFVTESALPPDELTALQKAAIEAAKDPSGENPFITESALPPDELTAPQKAAIEAAKDPSGENPFVTESALPEPQLTPDQEAAIDNAEFPSANNPFVTRSGLPIGVTPDQKDALDNANEPSADNPVATLADLGQVGIITSVVAAGTLDLSGATPSKTLGGLSLVANTPELGLATLTFQNYQSDRKDHYVVKALPFNAQAPQKPREFSGVQLVEFNEAGFVLHMAQPLTETFALGHCMIEVSEVLAEMPEPPPPSIEQAIRRYYSLIRQERFDESYVMLSEEFKTRLGVTTLEIYVDEWEKSGPAYIKALQEVNIESDSAIFDLELYYPKGDVTHNIRYEFVREEGEGHPRFGYWLFVRGNFIE